MKNDKIKSFLISSGVISALVGAIISGAASWYLLRKQIHDAENHELFRSRILMIKDTEELFARSALVKAIFISQRVQSKSLTQTSFFCAKSISEGENPKNCDLSHQEDMVYTLSKDYFDFDAQYKSLSRLVSIYFCQRSVNSFSELTNHPDWWQTQYDDLRADVLDSMYKEIECER